MNVINYFNSFGNLLGLDSTPDRDQRTADTICTPRKILGPEVFKPGEKEIEFALSTSDGNLDNFPASVYNHYEDIFKMKMKTL